MRVHFSIDESTWVLIVTACILHLSALSTQQSYSGTITSQDLQPTTAIEMVRAVVNNAPNIEPEVGVCGKYYLMSLHPGKGLQWNELPKNIAKPSLMTISVGQLEIDFTKKVIHIRLAIGIHTVF